MEEIRESVAAVASAVPSADIRPAPPVVSPVTKESLKELMAYRDYLESESDGILKYLNRVGSGSALGPVGVYSPLVDSDGFPRGDVDLMVVRSLRNKNARLVTDLRDVMKRIERDMIELHQQARESGLLQKQQEAAAGSSASYAPSAAAPTPVAEVPLTAPIAKIDEVARDSPADEAGLRVGDLVIDWAGITASNPYGLSAISAAVQKSVGKPMNIIVSRPASGVLQVTLTPKKWLGKGLIGCHISPPPQAHLSAQPAR